MKIHIYIQVYLESNTHSFICNLFPCPPLSPTVNAQLVRRINATGHSRKYEFPSFDIDVTHWEAYMCQGWSYGDASMAVAAWYNMGTLLGLSKHDRNGEVTMLVRWPWLKSTKSGPVGLEKMDFSHFSPCSMQLVFQTPGVSNVHVQKTVSYNNL